MRFRVVEGLDFCYDFATMTSVTNEATEKTAKIAPFSAKIKKQMKKEGRKKRQLKLKTDSEFAKKYFEGKSKRANDKKAAFRKKKTKKK